jgi:hypothetical protein
MTLLFHSMVLGFGLAALGAAGLSDAGLPLWAAVLVAWIGGNLLGLGFAVAGAFLWPERPARRSSFTVTEEEFRLWDEDLTRDLIDADLRRDDAAVPAAGQGLRTAG